MLALLFASVCSVCLPPHSDSPLTPPGGAAAVTQGPDGKPRKALDAWMKLYRKGKIDYRSKASIGKHSIAVKYKVRKPSDLGSPSWAGDLNVILKAIALLNDAPAARSIAEVASVGLDKKGKYTYSMAPYSVRTAALEVIATMSSRAAKENGGKFRNV